MSLTDEQIDKIADAVPDDDTFPYTFARAIVRAAAEIGKSMP